MPPSFTRGIFTIPLEIDGHNPWREVGVKSGACRKAPNGKPFVRDETIPGCGTSASFRRIIVF